MACVDLQRMVCSAREGAQSRRTGMETNVVQQAATPNLTERRTSGWIGHLLAVLAILLTWGLLACTTRPNSFTTLAGCVTIVLITVSSYSDIRYGKIRNSATYPAILTALVISGIDTIRYRHDPEAEVGLTPLGAITFTESFTGLILAFGLMLMIYHIAGGGAGDVKLAAALGSLLGPSEIVDILLWTYVVAGICVAAYLCVRLGPLYILSYAARKIGSKILPGQIAVAEEQESRLLQGKVRLAPFFAIGTIVVLSDSHLLLMDAMGR